MTELERVVAQSRKLGPRTRDLYQRRVAAFVEFAGAHPHDWTALNVERWSAALAREIQPQSVNVYLAAVAFASKRWSALGHGPDFAKPVERMRVRIGTNQGRAPRALTLPEVRRLVRACDGDDPTATRDRALILVALHAGFRRTELVSLSFESCVDRRCTATIKGGREHTVCIGHEAWDALQTWRKWLRRRRVTSGPLFRGLHKTIEQHQWTIGESLTGDGFYKILTKRATQAGLEGVHPHALRHTCASLLMQAGVPEWRVRKMFDHRSPITTARYITDLNEAPATDAIPPLT